MMIVQAYYNFIIIIIITVNLYSAVFVKKKNPKRAACASLVEREEKGFGVALKT